MTKNNYLINLNRNTIIGVFMVFLLIPLFALAETNKELIKKANEAYNNKQFEQAANLYEEVIQKGYEAPELYYNLGNAHFKMDNIAPAILYYEKAKKLDPNNEKIQYNLEVAKTLTIDKIEAVPEIFYVRWWQSLKQLFPADTWAKIGIGGIFLFFILLSFYYLSRRMAIKKTAFYTGLVVILLTIFVFIIGVSRYQSQVKSHEAIVFSPSVTAKSSPDQNSTDLFVMHEGTKVVVLDELNNWYEVKIADGSVGWVKEEDIREI